MNSDHSSQRSLPMTPPRRASQQSTTSTPTPPSTGRHYQQKLQTPPNHMTLPLSLPMSTMAAMTMSSMPLSMPLTMPLALPTDATTTTATQSHDVFGEHMYYGQESGSASNSNNNGNNSHAEVANMGMDPGLDSAMDMNLGMELGMDMTLGMDMDDVDMGVIMYMSMPEDNHMTYTGFSYDQTSSCNAQASSSSHGSTATNANHNSARQSTPPSMYLFNEPGMSLDNTTASPYGDPLTGYSTSSTTGGFPFNTSSSMAPSTLSSSYPSIYPIPQAATAAMEPTGESTFTTSMSLPTTSTLNSIAMSSPPLTRSRARHGRTYSTRSASDPIPSTKGRGNGHCRHTRGVSFDSADDDYFEDCCDVDDNNNDTNDTPANQQHQLRPGPNINGPPPIDPSDWRARLRYCEQAKHKASLDASLVRLLELSEGLDDYELEARRAANLRFDRVREQRLKDRNNEAAKRSRQRKVARIEAAEQSIASLRRERAQLAGEVQQLRRQLAAATSPGRDAKVHKGGRQSTTPQRRRSSEHSSGHSGHSGRLSNSPNGRGKHSRRNSDESAIDDEEDEDSEDEDHIDRPRHGNSIVVGMLA
ncbi:hypothetical protein Sste5346_008973 [Sporothrix stenoceras]|uniref:BZIP domain-containing protein n=1 Tax=Sporothrix stenoceras TaxID=5173 RepID=A0ABR3YN73_9PEZI